MDDTASENRPPLAREVLDPIYQLNARLLWLLRALCVSGAMGLVSSLGDFLIALDDESIARLARVPVALVDADFQDDEAWMSVTSGEWQTGEPKIVSCLSDAAAVELASTAFDVAATLARASPRAARLYFGMSPAVARTFSTLNVQVVRRLGQARAHWVRPRWQDQPQVWRRLIATAGAASDARLPVGVRALNRLLADLEPEIRAANETRRSHRSR